MFRAIKSSKNSENLALLCNSVCECNGTSVAVTVCFCLDIIQISIPVIVTTSNISKMATALQYSLFQFACNISHSLLDNHYPMAI